jgi:hypothetical protein
VIFQALALGKIFLEPRRPPKRHAVGEGFDHEWDDEQNSVVLATGMPLFEPRGNRKPRWVGKSK